MAERRCFTKKITESDAFLDMPLSTQCLYFHLNMNADDDGFINNPRKLQRMVGCSDDDLKLLIAKSFLLVFESGVIVIKHWRMHNTLQNDRYHPTSYQEEYAQLGIKDNRAYTFKGNQLTTSWQPSVSNVDTSCIQNVSNLETELNLTKHNITKLNNNMVDKAQRFVPPTRDEITSYCTEKGIHIDVDRFIDYYTANGWKVGRNPMKDWKATVRNWARGNKAEGKLNFGADEMDVQDVDLEELKERMFGKNETN